MKKISKRIQIKETLLRQNYKYQNSTRLQIAFFSEYPAECPSFTGPYPDACLRNLWLWAGCDEDGSYYPLRPNNAILRPMIDAMTLK